MIKVGLGCNVFCTIPYELWVKAEVQHNSGRLCIVEYFTNNPVISTVLVGSSASDIEAGGRSISNARIPWVLSQVQLSVPTDWYRIYSNRS